MASNDTDEDVGVGDTALDSSIRTRGRRNKTPSAREAAPPPPAASASASSGRASTRSRSPALPMSTRGRSPVNPPGSAATAASSGGSGGAAGTRSSGRRSANKLVLVDVSSGDSGKEDEIIKIAPTTTSKKRRGRTSKDERDGPPNLKLNEDNDADEAENEDDGDQTNLTKRKPLVLLGEKPRGLYECDYCGSDLTRTPRIRCADCPDFDLCLECFASEDHEHMAKYKREEEAQKRKDAAKLAGVEVQETTGVGHQTQKQIADTKSGKRTSRSGGKMSRTGRTSSKGGDKDNKGSEDNDPNALLGSYVGGVWVPYFRHTPDHGYLVADSTRYMMFPSFRGVRALEMLDLSNNKGKAAKEGDEEKAESEEEAKLKEESNEQKKDSAADSMDVEEVAKEGEKEKEGETESDDKPPAVKTNSSKEDMEVDSNDDKEDEKDSDEKKSSKTAAEPLESSEAKKEGEKATNVAPAGESAKSEPGDDATESKQKKYCVIDDPKNAWTAEEDLRLLDGILTCGLGNWPDIAEHVNGGTSGENGNGAGGGEGGTGGNVAIGGKTDKRCMERYLDDFMGRYGSILPPYTMVPDGEVEEEEEDTKPTAASAATDSSDGESVAGVAARKRPRRSAASSVVEDHASAPGFKKTKFRVVPTEELDDCNNIWPHPYIPKKTGVEFGEEVARDLWYRSEISYVRQTTSASSKIDAEKIRKEFMERRAQNLAGYEAKVLPPRLEDTKQLPGAELAGYMPRRGDFDMEWDNDAEKTISEMEFSSDDTKADKDLKLDVIRIFNAKLDEREKRKQFIIDQGLLNYRENQEKMWKMPPDERHLVQRMRMFARFHTKEEHEALVNKIIEAKRLRKEIAKLQMYRRLGITSLAEAEKYEIDKARREMHRHAWMKKEEEKRKAAEEAARAAKENATSLGIVAPPPPVPTTPVGGKLDGVVGAASNHSLQVWKQFKKCKEGSPEKNSSAETDTVASKFVIFDKPGYDLLSSKEIGLCKRLRLLPQNYLDVKKALISESLAQGIWNPSSGAQKNMSIFKIDVKQRDGIIDFVLEAGWIPARPAIVK